MIYLGINLLSKLKAQEMAGSLTGHYTSFLRQTNWTPFEPSWWAAVRYSLHISTGRYLVCPQAMLQDFLVDKYKDFRPASDTWQWYILIAYNFQKVTRNFFPLRMSPILVKQLGLSAQKESMLRQKWSARISPNINARPTSQKTARQESNRLMLVTVYSENKDVFV